MSTPRRPAPRSRPAPMIATGWRVSVEVTAGNLRELQMAEGVITVLRADDDELFPESLRALIDRQPELAVVAAARNGLEAIELAEELDPDAVVVDPHMPPPDRIHAVR